MALVSLLPPEDPQKEEEPIEYEVVMRTGRIWELEMVENAFRKANIPHFQQSENSGGLVLAKEIFPSMGPGEWWSFHVPKSYADRAYEILNKLPIEVTTNPDIWHFNPPEEGKWFFKYYAILTLVAIGISVLLYIVNLLRQ